MKEASYAQSINHGQNLGFKNPQKYQFNNAPLKEESGNKLLRQKYACRWSPTSWLLDYLRDEQIGVYTNGFTGRKGANPFAYGTVLEFEIFEAAIKNLIDNKSLKISRLEEFFDAWEQDINSPIVVLSGKWGKRLLKRLAGDE